MTDLTRKQLAELRGIVNEIDHPFKWYDAHDLTRTRAMPLEDARLIAAMEPRTVLALIAQCEAGLSPASGEDGELIARTREIIADAPLDFPDDAPELQLIRNAETLCARLSALLAERERLKTERDEARALVERNLATMGQHTELFQRYDARESASNAALADALGLLRALTTDHDTGEGPAYDVISTPQMRGDVLAARAFLAKHPEPSP